MLRLAPTITPFKPRFPSLLGVPDGMIYHYTSVDAFKSIMTSRSFLMTHYLDFAHHPNGDKNEIVRAADIYEEYVRPLWGKAQIPEMRQIIGDMYVLSTCARANNRHLWNEYAQQGSGVVIALDARGLYEVYGNYDGRVTPASIGMSRMDYDIASYRKLCAQSVEGLQPLDDTILREKILSGEVVQAESNPTEILHKYVPNYAVYAEKRKGPLGLLSLQKDTAYKDEQETRIIHYPNMIHEGHLELDLDFKKPWQKKPRAILPLSDGHQHIVKKIISLETCNIKKNEVQFWINQTGFTGISIQVLESASLK